MEELRQFLIDKCEEMYFAGGIGYAILDIPKIERASNEELIEIANELKIDINKFNTKIRKLN